MVGLDVGIIVLGFSVGAEVGDTVVGLFVGSCVGEIVNCSVGKGVGGGDSSSKSFVVGM